MMDYFYVKAYPANAAFWQQGAIDKRFKVGDQSLWSMVYGDNQYFQSRRFFFNLIRRQVNMICGYQRKNRKSTVTLPVFQDDKLSDQYNQVMKWSENRDGFHEYLSQAFEGACDTGISMLHMYPDYTLDPISGDIFTDQVSYNNFLIDPYFRKQDLSDCQFIWRRRWVTKDQAKALLPARSSEIDKMKPTGMKDGRFPLQAELINMQTNGLFAYDEFYYRSTREATVIIDPKSEQATIWDDDTEDSEDHLLELLRKEPWLKVQKKQIPTVKLGICMGSEVVYHGPNLLGIDDYPFVPVLCYHEPDIQSYMWRIQGVVRNLRDVQYLLNARIVIMEDILRSQINSGWIYPTDAVVDPKAFRQSGQGFLIPLKAGHTKDEIGRIDPPSIPASMLELSTMLQDLTTKISGVNEELLGSAQDDKAGILSMLRQGAGLTTLQTIFDKLDYSQRLYGKLRLQAIRKNFSKGKVRAILGQEPDERFFTSQSLRYGIEVEEGNYSATQRQTELQQLLHFREIGIAIPDKSILRAAIITNKAQVEQDMQEAQQSQAQAQQAQAQQDAKSQNAEIMVKYAKARSDLAREAQLMASAAESQAHIDDLEASAQHKETEADLNLVKLMISLEDLDLSNLRSSLELAQKIKQENGHPQHLGV